MASENETQEDIIAELREDAKSVLSDEHDGDCWSNLEAGLIYNELADRLEAARKRELLSKNAEYDNSGGVIINGGKQGNAAALREALELCYRIIHCAMVTGLINRDDANKAMDAYHSALSAPARNCDVYNTRDKALKACFEDRGYCSSPIDERKSVISFMLSGQEEVVFTNKEGAEDEQK